MPHFHGNISGVFLHGNGDVPGVVDAAANPPSSVTGEPTSDTASTITWVPAVSGGTPTGFDVQYEAPTGSGNWVTAAGAANPTGAGVTAFNVTGQTAGMQVTPRVRALRTGFAASAWTTGAPFYLDELVGGGAEIPGPTPVAFTGTVPAQGGTVGTAYSLALASYFSGNLTPFTYSVFSGSLPPGVTLNSSTGALSGTPTTAGSYSAVIRATDTGSNTANTGSIAFTVGTVAVPVAFSGTVPAQSASVGVAYSLALAGYFSGSRTPFAYSVFSGSLPPGVTLNSSTGALSGTPTTAGSYSAVIRATDTAASTANTGTIGFTVAAQSIAPLVTQHPSSTSVAAGASPVLNSTATGVPTPTGQWQRSNDAGSSWANISGQTADTLTLANVQEADNGAQFRRAYTNGVGGTVYSSVATLTVSAAWQSALNIYTLLAPFDQVDNLGGFAEKDPAARVTLAFEFKRFTPAPQSVAVSITRQRGAPDASPSAVLEGSAAIVGTRVFQRVRAGVAWCDYEVRAEVTATDGSVYVMTGILPVRPG